MTDQLDDVLARLEEKNGLRNFIGSMPVDERNTDNVGIALASYFEGHLDRPEEDPVDDELGWGRWVLNRTYDLLDRIAGPFDAALREAKAEVERLKEERDYMEDTKDAAMSMYECANEEVGELNSEVERLKEERAIALDVKSKEGLTASEWVLRAGKAEKEIERLKEEHRRDVDSFNKGFEAAQNGKSEDPSTEDDTDDWHIGYAWSMWEPIKAVAVAATKLYPWIERIHKRPYQSYHFDDCEVCDFLCAMEEYKNHD